ncbi:DUF421 domain-containing protein [Parapusillimonas granuli]|uniref:DUF421 domain-containing protein n=1 Tax=Parapusillimonas granuli TaxID=380911 RepID=A0A853G7G2_9BURK|nr:YetF domain-containing protein [Parapusillimonas granuli]MBB5217308.1 uncharacterized membrane protein YcaP (DUF421 family) [Parapusillimonas granuli]MEB2399321.1 DUF421 domain-containing protein [Alcaligenaceae bacterium]NYT50900.1 DUF421 domain-containing protein [Parapusillimonas granuli]
MFDMSLPWWEFVLRGAMVYLVMLAMVRVSGKRTVGQFTPFDLLVVMLLSEAVSNGLSGGDESVPGGLIVAATLVALNMLIALGTSHSSRIEAILEGREVLLGRNGKIFDDVLKAQRISRNELDNAFHKMDVSYEEMECVILEADGTINILKKR